MTRSKKSPDSYSADEEETAEIITLLLAAVSPDIDKATTYEILLPALAVGLGRDNAAKIGKRILATAKVGNPSSPSKQ